MDEKDRFLDAYREKVVREGPLEKTREEDRPEIEKGGELQRPKEQNNNNSVDRSKKLKLAITAGISLVAIVALAFVIIYFLNRGIEVMDFNGWTENDVKLWARDSGITLQIKREYNDEIEAGKVIEQGIDIGERIKRGQFLEMIISQGHDLSISLPLPDLVGMTKKEVEDWAEKNFMDKVRFTTEYSEKVPKGKVIEYEINDDTVIDEVKRSTPIYVTVSKGFDDEGELIITLPDFKEMDIASSHVFARENEIEIIIEEEYDEYIPEGFIISQSIDAEEKVAKNTEVTLAVSKGKMITIPDFSGYSKEKAQAIAAEQGISIELDERYSGQPAEAFISQSIKAGEEYKKGDVLKITYSLGNQIVLQSYVGQTKDAADIWAQELNEQGANITIKATYTSSNKPNGTILYQDKEHSMIGVNTTINVTVSRGKVVFVPDFVAPEGSGYEDAITREKALTISDELGIVMVFKEEKKKGRLPGEVWSQSIEPGKEITEGSKITLKYVPANVKFTIPDFEGMTEEDIIKGEYNRKLNINLQNGTDYIEGSEGEVYEQSLKAGTKVVAGSEITLTIAYKPPEELPGEGESSEDDENMPGKEEETSGDKDELDDKKGQKD